MLWDTRKSESDNNMGGGQGTHLGHDGLDTTFCQFPTHSSPEALWHTLSLLALFPYEPLPSDLSSNPRIGFSTPCTEERTLTIFDGDPTAILAILDRIACRQETDAGIFRIARSAGILERGDGMRRLTAH